MEPNDAYWNNYYNQQITPWDVGTITTPLKAYIDQLLYKQIAILIPGCGNGHEAAYLLERGFTNITLIDISSVLCQQLEKRFSSYLGKGLTIQCVDFFKHEGDYDLVLEQTFFCALDPSLRTAYAEQMHQILHTDGKIAGVLFNTKFTEEGPPFGGTREEYIQLFQQHFHIQIMEDCYNSIAPRRGNELFIKLAKKAVEQ